MRNFLVLFEVVSPEGLLAHVRVTMKANTPEEAKKAAKLLVSALPSFVSVTEVSESQLLAESQTRKVAAAWANYKAIDKRLSDDGKAKLARNPQRDPEARKKDALAVKEAAAAYKRELNVMLEMV